MKFTKYIMLLFAGAAVLSSCEDKDYPAGLSEFDHHYYAVYVPNNNTGQTVQRTQTALLKFPVQFYSTFVRNYDAVAFYGISQIVEKVGGVDTPYPLAVVGQDFAVVDKNGNAIQPDAAGNYSIVFPKAVQAMDTIYIKLLNSTVPGDRGMNVEIRENNNSQFYVDKFSTACLRPIKIK